MNGPTHKNYHFDINANRKKTLYTIKIYKIHDLQILYQLVGLSAYDTFLIIIYKINNIINIIIDNIYNS